MKHAGWNEPCNRYKSKAVFYTNECVTNSNIVCVSLKNTVNSVRAHDQHVLKTEEKDDLDGMRCPLPSALAFRRLVCHLGDCNFAHLLFNYADVNSRVVG